MNWTDLAQLDDPDYPAPTMATIKRAMRLAADEPEPLRAVSDAHGGVVLEYADREGFDWMTIRVSADGPAERCSFVNGKLLKRETINEEQANDAR